MEMLGNLLDNAWKWAHTTIRLTIIAGRKTDIVVEDDGAGIEADELDRILQRGGRQDETVAGHGIGLSVVRGMAEELGGSVEIGRSENLGGLRITVSLPMSHSHTGSDAVPAK